MTKPVLTSQYPQEYRLAWDLFVARFIGALVQKQALPQTIANDATSRARILPLLNLAMEMADIVVLDRRHRTFFGEGGGSLAIEDVLIEDKS